MIAMPSYKLPESVIDRIRPPERLTVSEWCDRHRAINAKYSAEPGRWHTSRVPYLREIMDDFADPSVGSIVFIKCARVGGTEFLNNILAYSVDARPMPIMYVLPTEGDVADEFSGRVKDIFTDSPKLSRHIPGGTWQVADMITLDTLLIYGGWASSPSSLIRKTCGVVVFDEIDNCEAQAGRLGNTWKVAAERLVTFGYRGKLVGVTTPTTEDATGWVQYQASDQRQYHVPCPHCGGYQVLTFASIKWPEGSDADQIELDNLAKYACAHCGSLIDQIQQRWMIDRGIWLSRTEHVADDDAGFLDVENKKQVAAAIAGQWRPKIVGTPPRTRARGYWINVLYSPWRTWSQVAAEFLRVKSEPEKLRVFVNSWLAEPWQNTVDAPDESWLMPKVTNAQYNLGTVPADVRVLLCGADVHQDRIDYVVRGFGPCLRSWLVDVGSTPTFEDLYERAFVEGYPLAHDPGRRMSCYALGCDSRYREDEVHEFAKQPGVAAIFGHERRSKPVEQVNIAPRNTTTKVEPRWVWNVHTTLFKSKLSRLMKAPLDGPGGWHLPRDVSDEYLKQVTAEHFVLKTDKSGRKKWSWQPKTSGRPNHWWDTEVYTLALTDILEQKGELCIPALQSESPRYGLHNQAPAKTAKHQTMKRRPRVTGGWVGA
jgi:phage terminase large subunit GpA-like protein